MTENMQSVDVIIPTYNAGNQLQDLLESLSGQDYCGAISVIIVDSGSTDQTIEIIKSFTRLPVKLIQIDNKDFTHSYARNLGADKSQAEVLLFMTQDAIPEDDKWLSKMVKPLGEGYAAVSCAEDTSDCPELFYKLCAFGYQSDIDIYKKNRKCMYDAAMSTEEVRKNASINNIACCIGRKLFLDYRFRGSFAEDLDLGKRLIEDGHKLLLQGNLSVKHYHVRKPEYFLNRLYAETKAVNHILDIEVRHLSNKQLFWMIVQTDYCIKKAFSVLKHIKYPSSMLGQKIYLFVFRQLLKVFELKDITNVIELIPTSDNIIDIAYRNYSYDPTKDNPNSSIRGFIKNVVEPYMKENKVTLSYEELKDCIHKQLYMSIGRVMAEADSIDEFTDYLNIKV